MSIFETGVETFGTRHATSTGGFTFEVWFTANNADHADKLYHRQIKEQRARARLGFEPLPVTMLVGGEVKAEWIPSIALDGRQPTESIVKHVQKRVRQEAKKQYYRRAA